MGNVEQKTYLSFPSLPVRTASISARSAEAFGELFRHSRFGGATVTVEAGSADLLALATKT